MRRYWFGGLSALLLAGAATAQVKADAPQWQTLFDGKTLKGWVAEPAAQAKQFSVRDGVIHIEGSPQGGWLHTDKKYADFTLAYEVRYISSDHTGNTGLILRSPEISISGRNWPGRGFEMESRDMNNLTSMLPPEGTILALQPGAPPGKFRFDTEAAARARRPTGEWNRVEIIAHGNRIWSKINGEWLGTAFNAAHPDGHVGFQAEDGIVEYRALKIVEHTAETVTPDTFVPLFDMGKLNGMSLNDPKHASNVSIRGDLLHLEGSGGYLKTDKAYSNYVMRLEFRTLTPEADSGVFLRIGDSRVDGSGWPLDTTEAQLRHQMVPPPTQAAGDRRWIGAILRREATQGPTTIDTSAVLSAYRGLNIWQEAVIEVDGGNVTWRLNGTLIGEAGNVAHPEGGPVGLQIGPGAIEFRRVEIKGLVKD